MPTFLGVIDARPHPQALTARLEDDALNGHRFDWVIETTVVNDHHYLLLCTALMGPESEHPRAIYRTQRTGKIVREGRVRGRVATPEDVLGAKPPRWKKERP